MREESILGTRSSTSRGRLAIAAALTLTAVLALALAPGLATAKKGHAKGQEITVMTRNLYLGADLSPALSSTGPDSFVDANGAVVRQVQATNFPLRAKALAKEILKNKPNLVGLQEVAEWRTSPEGQKSFVPAMGGSKTATIVQYDFLKSLLDQLNKHGNLYRAAKVNQEFDFEAPADEDPTGPTGINGATRNWRLTMRDVILARKGTKTSKASGGHFKNLLVETVSGIQIQVTRGWAELNAQVGDGTKFHFVDSHLEAFDDPSQVPSIRAQQASQLVGPNGPARSKLPVILVGDFNSDTKTEVQPGDSQAYKVLRKAGFVERSTSKPLSCCISDPLLVGGSVADFNHKVDHILTDVPKRVKLVRSKVVGRAKSHGLWPSDHAGLVSVLKLKG
jgi:endonuclease/exonuclease/phosphatase family metal-dependent hydrolase